MDRKVRLDWRGLRAEVCHCEIVVRGRAEDGIVLDVEKDGLRRLSDGLRRVKHLVQVWEGRMDAM